MMEKISRLVHALLQPLKLSVSLNGLLGEGVVEPPVDQRRHGGEAGGDELLELGALDGQHGLACGAQDLVDEGQSQHGGAGDGGSGDGAGGDMCFHGVSFLPAGPGLCKWVSHGWAEPWLGSTAPCRCRCPPGSGSCGRGTPDF